MLTPWEHEYNHPAFDSFYKHLPAVSWGRFTIIETNLCLELERIFIRPAKGKGKAPKSKTGHLVTIIPTGCVGLSSLTRVLPTIIEFELPDRKKDAGMGGTLGGRLGNGEAPSSSKNETYLAGFTTACNELLDKIGKRVITLDNDSEDQISCKAVWMRDMNNAMGTKGKDKGKSCFQNSHLRNHNPRFVHTARASPCIELTPGIHDPHNTLNSVKEIM